MATERRERAVPEVAPTLRRPSVLVFAYFKVSLEGGVNLEATARTLLFSPASSQGIDQAAVFFLKGEIEVVVAGLNAKE